MMTRRKKMRRTKSDEVREWKRTALSILIAFVVTTLFALAAMIDLANRNLETGNKLVALEQEIQELIEEKKHIGENLIDCHERLLKHRYLETGKIVNRTHVIIGG